MAPPFKTANILCVIAISLKADNGLLMRVRESMTLLHILVTHHFYKAPESAFILWQYLPNCLNKQMPFLRHHEFAGRGVTS